jgi:hypothetical protein
MDLIPIAPDGNSYAYVRECDIMGCSAVEYADNVEPTGKRLITNEKHHIHTDYTEMKRDCRIMRRLLNDALNNIFHFIPKHDEDGWKTANEISEFLATKKNERSD